MLLEKPRILLYSGGEIILIRSELVSEREKLSRTGGPGRPVDEAGLILSEESGLVKCFFPRRESPQAQHYSVDSAEGASASGLQCTSYFLT